MKIIAPATFYPHFRNEAGPTINLHKVLSVVHSENSYIHSIFEYKIKEQISNHQELKE